MNPFADLTMDFAALILNGLLIMLASNNVSGSTVDDLWAALGLALGLTVMNAILRELLTTFCSRVERPKIVADLPTLATLPSHRRWCVPAWLIWMQITWPANIAGKLTDLL
jgi:hypothetical protein